MAEFYVEQQYWKHWPKVLVMCRKNGRDVTHRRYVPEVETGEGMSITEELREWWLHKFPVMDKELHKDFTAIADRIDAEHERAMADAYLSGTPTDEKLAELGWVELPKDADGEYIHIGDVMENIVCPPVHREVTGVGAECFYGWDEGNGRYSQFGANCYRHHRAPTVEDVLREFAQEMNENLGMYTGEAIDADEWRDADAKTVEKYAARLRLREDA